MKLIKTACMFAGGLLAGAVFETVYFYRRTMIRQNAKTERTIKMAGTDWSQYSDFLAERKEYMLEKPHEDVYVTSFDGLKLHGVFFPSIIPNTEKKRLVICLHGYTSQSLKDFTGLTKYYLEKGYAMLHLDARAHGDSEGEYIGFGCTDRYDVQKWLEWAVTNCGEDVEIILHGISMGGSTALMASSLDLPRQLKGIVSDCSFTSPKEVFTHVLKTMYHLPPFPAINGAEIINKRLAGYGMDECNAKREVEKTNIPILFIHGSKDTFVPVSMCRELYEHCASPKKLLIVEGAAHGESYYKETAAYEASLDDFLGSI